jgi:hypothetical protein
MRSLAGTVALCVIAAPAFADTPQAAIELIASSHAQDVFIAGLSEPGAIVIRHPRSGMVCRMGVGAANRLLVFPQSTRGDNVGCESTLDGVTTVLFATRFEFATSLDEQIAGVEEAIRQRYPDALPFAATREISSDALPAHRTAAFLISRDGARSFTSAHVAQVGEWVIKLRYTAPVASEEAAQHAEAAAQRSFAEALADIVEARTPAP